MRARALQAAFWLALLAGTGARATTWYVATAGNDANPGTQAQPFQSIKRGIDMAGAGDTVVVGNGTYTGANNRSLFATSSGPKTIALQSSGGAANCIIDCQGQARGFIFQQGEGSGCHVTGFTVKNGAALGGGDTYGGGAYISNSSSPDIENCTFSGCTATLGGGALVNGGSAQFSGCTFTGNTAGSPGGTAAGAGMYINNGSPSLNGCAFVNNSIPSGGADTRGGGLFATGGSVTLTNTSFNGNAIAGGSANALGAGAYVQLGALSANGCAFDSNTLTYGGTSFFGGGGITALSETSINLTGCTLASNTVTYNGTGSLDLGGGGLLSQGASSLTLTACSVTGNQCKTLGQYTSGSGGGIFVTQGSVTANGCAITGNSLVNAANAAEGGGFTFEGSATLNNCLISGNSVNAAYANAGGGALAGGSVTNCIVAGNTLSGTYGASGSGLWLEGQPVRVVNCTITGNSGNLQGVGAIYATQAAHTAVNTIVYGNSPAAPVDAEFSGSVAFTYSDVQGGASGTGNINADPLFRDAANGDYRLSTGSPCIDKGTSSGAPSTDYAGNHRPNGSKPDIGAYEYYLADYYVDTATGKDSNSGAATSPFKTVGRAVSLATDGFTIHVQGGNYLETMDTSKAVNFVLWTSGLADVGTH